MPSKKPSYHRAVPDDRFNRIHQATKESVELLRNKRANEDRLIKQNPSKATETLAGQGNYL